MAEKQYKEITLSGKWATHDPATIGTNFQTLTNMRYTDTHPRTVSGMSKINSTALSTYLKVRGAYHFKKSSPAETHLLVQAYNTGLTASQILDNTTAIPSAGDYSATAVHTDSPGAGRGSFSGAPDGQLIYCNGVDTCIWGGNEMKLGAFLTTTSAVGDDGDVDDPKDYTEQLQNTKTDTGNIAFIGGGNDSYTVLLIHGDQPDGTAGTSIDDSSASNHTITAVGNAHVDTAYKKFGSGSILFDGTGDYLTVPDHANWYFGADPFTIDCWVYDVWGTNGLCGQYADANNYWASWFEVYTSGVHDYLRLYFKVVSASSAIAEYRWIIGELNDSLFANFFHIELSRNGTNVYLFVNGVAKTATVTTAIGTSKVPNIAAVLEVGGALAHSYVFDGWIDEFRISKGICRHTADFSLPSAPYFTASNTFLVGSPRPIQGLKAYVKTANSITSTLTGSQWDGNSWSTLTLTDNTDTGASLAQTGTITFASTVTTAKPRYMAGYFLYWYQFTLSAGSAEIYYVTLDAPFQNIVDMWDNVFRDVAAAYKRVSGYLGDITTKVLRDDYDSDDDTTYISLDGLGAFSDPNNCLEIGFVERQCGLSFRIPVPNATASTVMAVDYYNGEDYVSVGTIADGTSEGGVSFAKSGTVTWNNSAITDETKTDKIQKGAFWSSDKYTMQPLYFYRVRFDHILNNSCKLDYIGGITAQKEISYFKFSIFAQGRIFLCCDMSGEKNKALVSSKYMPQVYNGEDTAELFFGEDGELNCGTEVFSQYGGNLYSLILVFKDTETWVVAGQDLEAWENNIYPISTSVGCPAPQTLKQINLAIDPSSGLNRSLAIWQGANGVYMSDGRAPIPIHGDISGFFDPSDSRCIKASMVGDSTAWLDVKNQEYHLKIASGSSATTLNKELVYDFKRNKWFEIDRGTGNSLQCGTEVIDTNGNHYSYGFLDTGYTERLEYGNDFDGVDITSTIQLGDFPLSNSLALETRIEEIRLFTTAKTTTANSITCTHYGNTSSTGTDKTMSPANSGYRLAMPYWDDKLNGDPFHSLKFTMITDNETIGFEPLAAVVTYHVVHQR